MNSTQNNNMNEVSKIACSIEPWLSVQNSVKAIAFYTSAFGVNEVYRLEDPDGGIVVKLSVYGATFWLSGGSTDSANNSSEVVGGGTVRIILTVADPDAVFASALKAGASEVFPVSEQYGWRLGRVIDPFGLHWEIGHPLSSK
jgi:PhnB protein